MFRIFRINQYLNIRKSVLFRYFASNNTQNQLTKPNLRINKQSKISDIGPIGWFLLLVPATTFGLGTWQVQRKKWKENLIAEMQSRSNSKPIPLPEDLEELKTLEYYPVYVRGHFLHDKELYMGPRSLLLHGDAASQGGLLSKNQKNTGYLVVTPFKLADKEGWVPTKNKTPQTRQQGQITDEINLVGIVRLHEDRPTFIPRNNTETNSWFYRDLDAMAKITNASPVFLDAVAEFDVNGGPKGGQTRVTLRNEHLSYILTWYSLCAFTSLMWYRQFILKLPLI